MRTLLTSVLILATTQVSALSCMRPDPIMTFQFLASEPEPYFVIYGTLDFDAALLPPALSDDQMRIIGPIPAQFTGKGLSGAGFVTDYVSPVSLQITCAGQWCGAAQSGVSSVIFVEASEAPVTITAGPCGGRIFENPSDAVLQTLTRCMQGGPCSP